MFEGILGRSSAMLALYELIQRVAPTDASVLITGESGTAKERVAEAIHRMSARPRRLPAGELRRGVLEPDRERTV